LTIRGTELSYVDRGTGMPLVLVHGFPLDHTMWAGQINGLARQSGDLLMGEAFWPVAPTEKPLSAPSLRIIAPDLRGFGRSPVGDDKVTCGKVTMEQFADDLAGLLDALDIREPVVLAGLSMGGYVALQFWRRHAARLRGLILCDTRAGADPPEVAAGRLATAERVLREGPAPLVEGMLPRLFAEATRRKLPGVVEGVRAVMLANNPRGIAAAARGMAERPDMAALLGRIRCPALVVVGRNDVVSPPAEMRRIAEAIAGAQFVEIPDAGHLAPLENPAAVNAAIGRFVATL
jgi:pimeloyl-ACP methyl ester carboxylesterase